MHAPTAPPPASGPYGLPLTGLDDADSAVEAIRILLDQDQRVKKKPAVLYEAAHGIS